jgi:16S rRNA processing protein RimM
VDRLAIGRIRTPHGLNGYLKVKSLSGETRHLLDVEVVYVRMEDRFLPLEVERAVEHGREVLLKLKGIESPEEGKRYSGLEIWADRRHACPLGEGEYYVADLCGCRVLQHDREIGRVVAVAEGEGRDFLEVEGAAGQRWIVPFQEVFVGEVDVAGRSILLKEEYELP